MKHVFQIMVILMRSSGLRKLKVVLTSFAALLFVSVIIIFPMESYQSALSGLDLFLNSVFPALLPFFIASEIMIGLGIVDFFSVLLKPVMEPLFCCPGDSSFIWVMSMASGYPAGARLTAAFLKQRRITVYEAQRILSFTSTSGPLFMMGAVEIGMMGTKIGGLIIVISHYTAALFLGLGFRFYHSKNYRSGNHKNKKTDRQSCKTICSQALSALYASRRKDGRPVGQLIGDAVRNSVNVLWIVGGFIMFFSVIIDLSMRLKIIDWLASITAIPIKMFSIEEPLIRALTGGLIEITKGSKLISETAATMQAKIAGVSFIIGWSGLCIHAQSVSFLSGTGIRIGLYIIGKFLHGLLAAIISIPLTHFIYPEALTTASAGDLVASAAAWRDNLLTSIRLVFAALLFITVFALFALVWQGIKKKTVVS